MAPPGRQFGPSFMKKKEEEKLSLRGCRVPSKAFFTAKHLTVFGLFRIALSKRRGDKKRIEQRRAPFGGLPFRGALQKCLW